MPLHKEIKSLNKNKYMDDRNIDTCLPPRKKQGFKIYI